MEVAIHFLGAAKTVTGSKILVETPGYTVLIDCGVFQGLKELRLKNWDSLSYPAASIDAVILTHGHLDHCGYLPRLVQQGFNGKIIGTAPTLAIAKIILEDSAHIHQEAADRANREGYSKHQPAMPFYTEEDVKKTLPLFISQPSDTWITLASVLGQTSRKLDLEASQKLKFRYIKVGHILGACAIVLDICGKNFVFSGDVGRPDDPLLSNPSKPLWADVLFLESTYGNRLHSQEDTIEVLATHVKQTIHDRGTLIIPSFAVERLQTLMYLLWLGIKSNKIPRLPVFIDSPMGTNVFQIFKQFADWHTLDKGVLQAMEASFTMITSYADTWKTIDDPRPKVVIAGSGMVTGGRVLTYLQQLVDEPSTTVLLAGFQAEGTRGRQLQEGAHEIKINGKYHPVRAKVAMLEGLSAHADQAELLDWLSQIKNVPENVFLVHGEPTAADTLRVKLQDHYHWKVRIPNVGDTITMTIAD